MTRTITCFLPCRKGSERVPRKNIKPFGKAQNGLIEIKLNQLISANLIDRIVLSTNDTEILDYAKTLRSPKLQLHHRTDELSSSSTSTDKLISHAFELIPEGDILWTHVTSPFINASLYDDIIKCYLSQLGEGYDSLMTTTLLHGFLWQNGKPINYDRAIEKWPRTQTLVPVHEVNSGVFLAPSSAYRELNDRIGQNPYLYAMERLTGHDIDWPEDFIIAESLIEKGLLKL